MLRARHGRPVWVFDGALAAVLLVLAIVEMAVRGEMAAGAVAWVVLALLPVTVRRLAPEPAAMAVACLLVVSSRSMGWDQPAGMFAALLTTLYAVGEAGRVAGAAVVVGVMWLGIAADTEELVSELVWSLIVMAMPWGAGRAVGVHRRRTAALRELTARLEREREAGMRLAVVQERARVAGEVHDGVAHVVAGMLAQARAASVLLDRDPAGARAALTAVQESGREAVARMRSTLGALRAERPAWRPQDDGPAAPPSSSRRAWRWPAGSAAALVAVLVAMWAVEIVWYPDPVDGSRAVSAVLAAIAIAAVALRTRTPLLATAVVLGAAGADVAFGGVTQQGLAIVVAVLLTTYAVGAHPVRARAVAGGLLTVAALAADDVLRNGNAGNAVFILIMVGTPWAAGALARRHHRQGRELAELARALEREHRANARLAVLGERTHMARELHDTVAHGVNVMVVQAAVAEQATPADPIAARAAIDAIGATGRDVLAELQRLLGLLAIDERAAPLTPQPTLEELDELVGRVRLAGLPVTLRVEGTPEPVPADVATSAYRIVQEALTNVLKHAGRPPTAVVVRYLRGALDLSVDDDGPGVATLTSAAAGGGHGLVGMRERAALAGGMLEAGPRSAGGYAVHARLPLES